jgi:hypothetical protein
MLLKAVSRLTFLILLACLALHGCSTGQSRGWVDDKASFNDYGVFEVRPVFNATGGDLKEGIAKALTTLFRTELAERQLPVAQSSQTNKAVLIVKSSIVVYDGCELIKGAPSTGLSTPGPVTTSRPMGKSMCTVQTQLIDKVTGQIVARIFTTKVVGACYTEQYKSQWLLKVLAEDIAKKIAKIMKA